MIKKCMSVLISETIKDLSYWKSSIQERRQVEQKTSYQVRYLPAKTVKIAIRGLGPSLQDESRPEKWRLPLCCLYFAIHPNVFLYSRLADFVDITNNKLISAIAMPLGTAGLREFSMAYVRSLTRTSWPNSVLNPDLFALVFGGRFYFRSDADRME